MGLVEFGVGLIPAGGGTKEMTLRTAAKYEEGEPEYNLLRNTFHDHQHGQSFDLCCRSL